MKKDFFPVKPDNNPKIYAYTENTPEYKDLIKIGYTARSLDERMKEHYPTIIPNQLEYFERFEMHDDPLDKKHAVDAVHTLCDSVLRKTEKGRSLESFYELIPL